MPTRQGRPVDLVITVGLSTLAALDLPGNLTGHGAITAQLCRTLAAAARTVTMLVLDPVTGTAVGVGERTYVPKQKLRDKILALTPTCRWIACGMPAWRCELDHREPFNHHHPHTGGHTSENNLDGYCKAHHFLKTHADWVPQRNPDRSITLTSPTGNTYTEPAPEFTLPSEWLHHIPNPGRATIGAADQEHTTACAAPHEPEPKTGSPLTTIVQQYLFTQRRQHATQLRRQQQTENQAAPTIPEQSRGSRTLNASNELTPVTHPRHNDDPPPF